MLNVPLYLLDGLIYVLKNLENGVVTMVLPFQLVRVRLLLCTFVDTDVAAQLILI